MSTVIKPQRASQCSRSFHCRVTTIARLSLACRPPTCNPLLQAGQVLSVQPAAAARRRSSTRTAAVATPTPLFDFPTHQLFPTLKPSLQFILDRLIEDILVPVVIAWAVLKFVDWISNAAQKAQEQLEGTSATTMLGEMLVLAPIAVKAPTQAVTLVVLFTHLARNVLWIIDRWTHRFHESSDTVLDTVLDGLCSLLVPFDRFMVKLYSACVVAFVTWAVIRWKSLLLTYMLQQHADGQQGALASSQDLERLVLPLDGVSSWVMSAIGAFTILHVAGINLQPLLALGGVSSLVVGLASQQLLTNTVLGFNFFLSRPFVAGDMVQFNGPGNLSVTGVVDKVAPMRVMLRTEDGAVVSIPNKVVSDMIIYNRTKEAGPGMMDRVRLRQPLRVRIKVPHASMDKLAELKAALGAQLAAAGGLVIVKGEGLVLGKFTEAGVDLTAQGMLQQDYTSRGVQELLLALCSTCRQHGATMVTL